MSSKRPSFKLYVKDFVAATGHMSCAERGAYITLLCTAWVSEPEATLPDDAEKLRRIAGADRDEWERIKANVLEKFEANERFPGRLMNKRLRETFEDAEEYADTMKERAKKGAAARWKKTAATAAGVREPDEE
jgi:uncharacterized protein YdaU (DUF1376 family)